MQRLLIAPLSPPKHPCGSLPKLLRRRGGCLSWRARVVHSDTPWSYLCRSGWASCQILVLHFKEAHSCMLANAAASSQTPLPAPPSVTRSITVNAIAGSAAPVRSRKLALYHDFKKNARPLSMLASLISFSLIPRLTDRCLCIFDQYHQHRGNRKENIQFVCSGKQEDEAMIPMIKLNVHLFCCFTESTAADVLFSLSLLFKLKP